MEIVDRKPGRVLWTCRDPEGRTRYEWRCTTAEGVAIEPASCGYASRHQANLAWKADNPGKAGRPVSASPENRSADGNPKLTVRLEPSLFARVQALGGAAWVRELIGKSLTY